MVVVGASVVVVGTSVVVVNAAVVVVAASVVVVAACVVVVVVLGAWVLVVGAFAADVVVLAFVVDSSVVTPDVDTPSVVVYQNMLLNIFYFFEAVIGGMFVNVNILRSAQALSSFKVWYL